MEILRCLLYFPFEYLLIGPFGWYISKDRLTFTTNLLIIRITHIFSIIFWIIYIIIKSKIICMKSRTQTEEVSPPQTVRDAEKYNPSEKQTVNRVEQMLFVVAIICLIISFLLAFALNMKSCENIFNQLLIGEN